MTMNRWGSHFDRTQPWWQSGGKAWFTYMARGQHMLRQGVSVADVALLVGSNSPVECPETRLVEGLPVGVTFDCLDTPSLLERAVFEDSDIVLPGGVRYQMLWWPHADAPNAARARPSVVLAESGPAAQTRRERQRPPHAT